VNYCNIIIIIIKELDKVHRIL